MAILERVWRRREERGTKEVKKEGEKDGRREGRREREREGGREEEREVEGKEGNGADYNKCWTCIPAMRPGLRRASSPQWVIWRTQPSRHYHHSPCSHDMPAEM